MTTILRKTDQFEFIQADLMGTTLIQDNYTGRQTAWNTGTEAEEEKDHLLSLSDEDFNEYCEMQTVASIE